jgi:hypothetical protein
MYFNLSGLAGISNQRRRLHHHHVPTASSTEVSNLNNNGVMVGWYYDSAGAQLAFIATP